MILGNGDGAATEHAPMLDELFRRAGVRHPQAIALIDPPNRKSFHRRSAANIDLCGSRRVDFSLSRGDTGRYRG
jgi:hypothetical protein